MSAPRILVVDDEASILETVGGVLRDQGFDVETAATGREALAIAVAMCPDLLVLDVMLPDCDGLEVTRRLRAEARDPGILFLTARDSVEDRITGLRLGGDDYLTKPFSLEEVVARVEAILRRTRPANGEQTLLQVGDSYGQNEHEGGGHLSPSSHATEFLLPVIRKTRQGYVKSKLAQC